MQSDELPRNAVVDAVLENDRFVVRQGMLEVDVALGEAFLCANAEDKHQFAGGKYENRLEAKLNTSWFI